MRYFFALTADRVIDNVLHTIPTSRFACHRFKCVDALLTVCEEDIEESVLDQALPESIYPERELKDGQELRFTAYRTAWRKCLNRIQVSNKCFMPLTISD